MKGLRNCTDMYLGWCSVVFPTEKVQFLILGAICSPTFFLKKIRGQYLGTRACRPAAATAIIDVNGCSWALASLRF